MIQLVWTWFSNFICVNTIIQVVHNEFIRVALTEYSAFKSSCKMIQEQVVAAVVIVLISEKSKSRRKRRKKKESMWNLGLKEEKNLGIY